MEQMITETYRLRPAQESDRAWFDKLWREVYREMFIELFGQWDADWIIQHYDRCWQEGNISVIQVNSVDVGLVQLAYKSREVEIKEIQICRREQGKGIGSLVVNNILESAVQSERDVSLKVALKNLRARQFYTKLGFVECGTCNTHCEMKYSCRNVITNDSGGELNW